MSELKKIRTILIEKLNKNKILLDRFVYLFGFSSVRQVGKKLAHLHMYDNVSFTSMWL